jgi:uncharacterized membrane protein YdjX (TVP38/TMEM64 family)
MAERGMKLRGVIFRLLLVAGLAGAVVWVGVHREFLQAAELERELGRFGSGAPILFVLLYALATVLFAPGSILTVTGGALFGPLWGTLWNLIGATFGATLAFLIARYVGSDWVARRAGERLARVIHGVEEEGWRFVAFVRLVPLFPFNLVNYAFGLTRIRLGEYVLASFLCMAPAAVAYTYLGYAGREAASGQAGSIRKALFALAMLATVAFVPRLVRRLKGQRYTDAASLKSRLEKGEKVALLDVRTAEEFRGPLGHLAGATSIPIAELPLRLKEVQKVKGPIVTI